MLCTACEMIVHRKSRAFLDRDPVPERACLRQMQGEPGHAVQSLVLEIVSDPGELGPHCRRLGERPVQWQEARVDPRLVSA
jgi:hypothetical protein